MYRLILLYLACILAGFVLNNLPTAAGILTAPLLSFFSVVGVIVIIVFVFALVFLGIKALAGK
ncbi:MAG TPA: hypothetical protein VEY51_17820 [Chondromyces sp.]|nr:hypothetical protein [Chondromyces sp.]